MAISLYARYVNKRISAARQLLICSQGDTLSTSTHILQSLLESAVLQARLGFHHYLYELLEAYQEDCGVDSEALAVSGSLFKHRDIPFLVENHKATVTEFAEFSQLLLSDSSWLAVLSAYPDRLLSDPLSENQSVDRSENAGSDGSILRLVDVDSACPAICHPLDLSSASWLIDQVVECIQRQREHLIEC